ncbi:WD40 repeat-like protein [Pluteus cervinus]|uniref:WD40 repeat-like protein n=1 Tax=Pluteus cervinus TaxID=181527 RepID=A0ACD3B4I9_9AGAR|nr:WD40 repeat-like protein [Pluteus cervinus]
MADEGTNLQLQKSLDALPLEEREAINAIWSNFSSSPHPRRALILQGLLTMCCFSQLSLLTEQLAHIIRIDPVVVLPREVSMKILGYLDATSLCRAAQVAKRWKSLADDDILWRGICEQHIGQKCRKCGWGLPILESKRTYRPSPCPSPPTLAHKRPPETSSELLSRPAKRLRSDADDTHSQDASHDPCSSRSLLAPQPVVSTPLSLTRPWKHVYSERMTIERNWRRGRCTVRTLQGHTDGVMCLQFSETLSHPAFPVLITGSYDRTVRVWNMETGCELHCLKGHTRAVRALQFDEVKLITGSMDHTLKVWDWRRGNCIRTLEGHTDGVVCLNFDSNVLASGSVDSTIKVWNLRTGGAFTLRGHTDWVNSVQLWDSNTSKSVSLSDVSTSGPGSSSLPATTGLPTTSSRCSSYPCAPEIDPGKMLFSASDDGTIRLWDLTSRACVKQFTGHVGQVQSMKLLLASECDDDSTATQEAEVGQDASSKDSTSSRLLDIHPSGFLQQQQQPSVGDPPLPHPSHPSSSFNTPTHTPFTYTSSSPNSSAAPCNSSGAPSSTGPLDQHASPSPTPSSPALSSLTRKKPVLISGSLDNTIKLWDIETGKNFRTYFGHIEGVWVVACDKLRLVSGSNDRTIKVWSREEARCTSTLVGHQAAVSCLALGEDKIVSGSDDCTIKIWNFSD